MSAAVMDAAGTAAPVRELLAELEERLAPLLREANLASWDAAAGGGDAALERAARARAAVAMIFSDAGAARRVRGFLADEGLTDAALRRQLVLLDHEYTRNQLPAATIEDLVARSAELEHVFHTFRSTLHGQRLSNNELQDALRATPQGGPRRAAWEASKEIGGEVAERLRELVRRRNAAARELGFADFYVMELHLQELGEAPLFTLLDAFREQTEAPYRTLAAGLEQRLAERSGIAPEAVRPWHWDDFFAQQAPSLDSGVDLDACFASVDLVELARGFFRGLGLPADEVLARSDLFEREGKDQHAFCVDVDRLGDVRVLCNLRPDERWMGTLLHELGHAVYDRAIPSSLPFFLRTIAHTLTTEAVAMYMGRLTRDPAWLREVAGARLDPAQAADVEAQSRTAMLVATRWMLVMAYFERELYRDPDRPDLDALWWELVEKIQFIRRPEGRSAPDWAAKIHLSLSPVYYHNYLLGELMASQLAAHARGGVPADQSIAGHPSVGDFLRERVFAPGASLSWNELLVHATGEPLDPRYFVREFVGEGVQS